MEKGNYVALVFGEKSYLTRVLDVEGLEGLKIDYERKRWSYNEMNFMPIGRSRYLLWSSLHPKEGVIGVYDKRDTKQLDNMVNHAREATFSDGSLLDD